MMNKTESISLANIVARTLSVVLHPMLMPVYILFFIFSGDSMFAMIPQSSKLYCYLITIFSLLLMPLASLPFFKHFHLIRSYDLNDKQDRVYPILIAVAFAFLGFWLLGRVAYTNIVQQLYLVLIILLSTFSVITIRWKMSMHMTAMGGVCGFLLIFGMKYPGDVRSSLILMLILAGLLAASRLYLKKHNPMQIYLGFLFGLLFVVGILF